MQEIKNVAYVANFDLNVYSSDCVHSLTMILASCSQFYYKNTYNTHSTLLCCLDCIEMPTLPYINMHNALTAMPIVLL